MAIDSPVPACEVCGATEGLRLEPRFDYFICGAHADVPPNQIHEARRAYQARPATSEEQKQALQAHIDAIDMAQALRMPALHDFFKDRTVEQLLLDQHWLSQYLIFRHHQEHNG